MAPIEKTTGKLIEHRVCTRCLLRELAASDAARRKQFEQLESYRSAVKPVDRVGDAEYECRLQTCTQCDRLVAGTCMACGCYVELRAVAKAAHCPKKKW